MRYALLALLCSAVPVMAEKVSTDEAARQLGLLIGSEQVCGLTYDPMKIQQIIVMNVPRDDAQFGRLFQTYTTTTRYRAERMGVSEKAAHCAYVMQGATAMNVLK